jgi:hypothetical protein
MQQTRIFDHVAASGESEAQTCKLIIRPGLGQSHCAIATTDLAIQKFHRWQPVPGASQFAAWYFDGFQLLDS